MSAVLTDSVIREPRPNALFVGKARAFRNSVSPSPEVGVEMRRIAADAWGTLQRRQGRGYRPEYLVDVERAWRRLDATGRLDLQITRDRKRLTIEDVRINTGTVVNSDWARPGEELSLNITPNRLILTPLRCETAGYVIVSFSLLALARFFQKSSFATNAALLADLQHLARIAPELLASQEPKVAVETRCGRWLGRVSPYRLHDHEAPENAVAIRTFA